MDSRKKTVKVSVVIAWDFKHLCVTKRENDCTNKGFSLEQAVKAQRGNRGIAILLL
jgi:hypothetical protein